MGLTDEQRARIEANRQAALRRRDEARRRASAGGSGGAAGPSSRQQQHQWQPQPPQPLPQQQPGLGGQQWGAGGGGGHNVVSNGPSHYQRPPQQQHSSNANAGPALQWGAQGNSGTTPPPQQHQQQQLQQQQWGPPHAHNTGGVQQQQHNGGPPQRGNGGAPSQQYQGLGQQRYNHGPQADHQGSVNATTQHMRNGVEYGGGSTQSEQWKCGNQQHQWQQGACTGGHNVDRQQYDAAQVQQQQQASYRPQQQQQRPQQQQQAQPQQQTPQSGFNNQSAPFQSHGSANGSNLAPIFRNQGRAQPQQQDQYPHQRQQDAPPPQLASIFRTCQQMSTNAQTQQQGRQPLAPQQGPPFGQHGQQGGQMQGGMIGPTGPGPKTIIKAELGIVDAERFGVFFTLNQAVVNALKAPSLDGVWNTTRRVWTFPYDRHGAVKAALSKLSAPAVDLTDLNALPLKALKHAAGRCDDTPLYEMIPEKLESCLFPFQREGVEFALSVGGRVILGDEMGLGKTLQALALIGAYSDDWPALVLCPSSLREMWRSMVLQWLPSILRGQDVSVVTSGKDSPLDGKICIVPYDYASKLQERLRRRGFGVVVADEAHYLKSHKAQRTKAALPVVENARRAILLSGTPALSRPMELYTLVKGLVPKVFTSYNAFGNRYCTNGRFGFTGAVNKEELNVVLKCLMIRRLKKDVLTQLPDKTRCQIFMSVTENKEFKALKARMEEARSALGSLQCDADFDALMSANSEQKRLVNEYYNATAELKRAPVAQYVRELAEGEDKFLVFAHHQCVLDAVEQACVKSKVEYIRIDGTTPVGERHQLCNSFQAEGSSIRVAVLSIKVRALALDRVVRCGAHAGANSRAVLLTPLNAMRAQAAGAGLTLTAASTVVFAEYSWVPGDLKQAEDRAHRIGQKNTVNIVYLHARNTVDDLMWRTVQNKLETVGHVLDGADNVKNVGLAVANGPGRGPAAPRGKGQTALTAFMRKSDASDLDHGSDAFCSTDEEHRAKRRRPSGA